MTKQSRSIVFKQHLSRPYQCSPKLGSKNNNLERKRGAFKNIEGKNKIFFKANVINLLCYLGADNPKENK